MEFDHAGIRAKWSPEFRIVEFSYEDDQSLTGEAADAIIPVVAAWVADGAPYGFLVDASSTMGASQAWQKKWAEFQRAHAQRARIAVVRPSAFIRGIIAVYGYMSGVDIRPFANDREARVWLIQRDAAHAPPSATGGFR